MGILCNRVNVRVKWIGKLNVEILNKVICDCIFFFVVVCFCGFLIELWLKYIRLYVCVLFLGGVFGGKVIDIVL